ncbi:MAG: acyltransferase [Xanthomonadales bacterium]|nr:putative acyltransferase YihG [Xanthomonadales bacterium]MCC6592862.1 acyltransferase [Xanthomonadales bacterium]MCE7931174.1 acyltransferase [Xanthomonadales bacterium PRO6]
MLSALPGPVLLPLTSLLAFLSTLLHVTPLLAVALLKFLLPLTPLRRALNHVLTAIAESWIEVNSAMIRLFTRRHDWRVEGIGELRRDGWFLVLCNHQSWVDILVLQYVCNRRIPFLKFFLKQQLIWVPLLGLAWWALDFPFMRRYTKAQIARRPELRGKDIAITRRACAKFAEIPVSVMNFVEGTRYTPAKHAQQASPYAHLLKPKAGGVAFVLETMGSMLQSVIDVTIVYPQGRPTLIDLLCGRVARVDVHVARRPIPRELLGGSYEDDAAVRERFQAWVNGLWAEKDRLIASRTAA